nr:hypothetical protein [Kibdelosporangium sp. MJ126-NF4]CTQ99205.1 hypothetical protein [Kibdelosporangium sp. MJ126-NF4]
MFVPLGCPAVIDSGDLGWLKSACRGVWRQNMILWGHLGDICLCGLR